MKLSDIRNQRILFSCLDWGSGHVARSIGLLRELIKQNNTIFLYCSVAQKTVFECYDLSVTYLVGEKFHFRFKGDGNFSKEMLRNGFRFSRAIEKEKVVAETLAIEHQIDLILSDHCYGFRSDKVKSIFITHQVQLPPKSGRIAQRIHHKWIRRFSGIWIMDEEKDRLAGVLSSPIENGSYIGWFSRFSEMEITSVKDKTVAIISGPEPYSMHLFHEILSEYAQNGKDLTVIAPISFKTDFPKVKLIRGWLEADKEIASAETIISRNGYSTLMDLKFLNKKAILIPTPGQLEQEYLAELS